VDRPAPTPRILVVDDDEVIRRLLALTLTKQGYDVDLAESGAEALDRLDPVAPDLVLIDASMPDMDGYEVCRRIRATGGGAQPRLVMMSAADGDAERERAGAAGAEAFVAKPIERARLVDCVRELLERP
jgi:CheY-like chemotaxis protein